MASTASTIPTAPTTVPVTDELLDTAIQRGWCFQKAAQRVRRSLIDAQSDYDKLQTIQDVARDVLKSDIRDDGTKQEALRYLQDLCETHSEAFKASGRSLLLANVLLNDTSNDLNAFPYYKHLLLAATASLCLPTEPCTLSLEGQGSPESILPEDHLQAFTAVRQARAAQAKEAVLWAHQASQLTMPKNGAKAYQERCKLRSERSAKKLQARSAAEEEARKIHPGLLALASFVSDFATRESERSGPATKIGSDTVGSMIPLPVMDDEEESVLAGMSVGLED